MAAAAQLQVADHSSPSGRHPTTRMSRDISRSYRQPSGCLGRRHGFGRDGPARIGAGKQPACGPPGSPIATQQFQQFGRQQSLSIHPSFAAANPQDVANAVDVVLSWVTSETLSRLNPLGPVATQGGSVAAVENTAPSSGSAAGTRGAPATGAQYGW